MPFGSTASSGPSTWMPAWLCRMSIRPKAFERAADQAFELRVVADVRLDGERPPAGFCDASSRLLAGRCIRSATTTAAPSRAMISAPARADARAGAGDDGDAVLEDHRACLCSGPTKVSCAHRAVNCLEGAKAATAPHQLRREPGLAETKFRRSRKATETAGV